MESFKNACAAAVVAIACGIYAQDEIPIASAEFGLGFDSRYMTYGVIDGKMRKAAAAYNGAWGAGEDKTWNFVGGLSLAATF
jgi:hypothetical protein